jgi:O-methyltransferase
MKLISELRFAAGSWRRKRQLRRIYSRFREFTMVPEDIYIRNLQLAERCKDVPGSVVECGVWRGGMIAGIATLLGPERDYFLFDSFTGLPPAKPIDGAAALHWQSDKVSPHYYENCSAPPGFAQQAMRNAGARSFELVKGWFNETLPNFVVKPPIALLRLDGDWYESTTVCLDHLFERVAPHGLIVLDDYFAWDGCSRALHDFLSRRSATERIQSFEGVCHLIKSASEPNAR